MSNTKHINDGGPAFPVGPEIYHGTGLSGMSLRDWFAGQALNGMDISQIMEDAMDQGATPEHFASVLAIAAYKIADGMIAARSQNP